jgi:hypothetical protein
VTIKDSWRPAPAQDMAPALFGVAGLQVTEAGPGPGGTLEVWAVDDIPELLSLARTISRWEDQIICAVLTGITNATSESLNRLAKLEARLAYGFRNPANQRRRVRIACTRGTRRKPRTATRKRTPKVTSQKPHPG